MATILRGLASDVLASGDSLPSNTMPKTIKGRVGWEVLKKLLKAIPYVGTAVTIGLAGREIKKKGLVPGAIHVGLDLTPVVGTTKNVVEIFTGDWIPDKQAENMVTPELGPPAKPTSSQ